MTQTHAAYVDGTYRCYRTETGKDRLFVGCRHLLPASAVRHVTNLDPFVSPTRSGSTGTSEVTYAAAHPVGGVPSPSLIPEAPAASRVQRTKRRRT